MCKCLFAYSGTNGSLENVQNAPYNSSSAISFNVLVDSDTTVKFYDRKILQ